MLIDQDDIPVRIGDHKLAGARFIRFLHRCDPGGLDRALDLPHIVEGSTGWAFSSQPGLKVRILPLEHPMEQSDKGCTILHDQVVHPLGHSPEDPRNRGLVEKPPRRRGSDAEALEKKCQDAYRVSCWCVLR